MLPESQFPVTGGIMQTEEVLPRAHSTELDDTISESKSSFLQPAIKFTQQYPQSFLSFSDMAVKQETQDEDEHSRHNKFSPKTETDNAQSISDGSPNLSERETNQSVPELDNTESPGTLQNGSKKIPNRGRRKSRWKLKFHHQALPPEYLDHYEAALAQETVVKSPTSNNSFITSPLPSTSAPSFKPSSTAPGADVQSWLQHLASMQNDICAYPMRNYQPPNPNICQTTNSRRSVITSTQLPQTSSFTHQQLKFHHQKLPGQSNHSSQRSSAPAVPRPPMKYSDLPYMGEITLDNSKPRRGRKPKKADICHLIYKNYGTILPGTPGLEDNTKSPTTRNDQSNVQVPMSFQRTDIQNRISSLLEKRLTQEKRALELAAADHAKEQEEPLNLCIRDLNLLKIRLNDKYSGTLKSFNAKSEESSDAEDLNSSASGTNLADTEQSVDSNSEINNSNLKLIVGDKRMGNNNSQLYNPNSDNANGNNDILNNNDPGLKKSSDLLYWPNAGVFIHPAALQSQYMYYQKLAQEKGLTTPSDQPSKEPRVLPKSIYSLLETPNPVAPNSTDSSSAEAVELASTPSPRPKRNSTSQSGQATNQPVKRKRSAIFIPPMPTENNSNPTTEVSICKFKFTGGAKPSLQEKKSLSVDSGGNFRYYSGTGDKSMRGYEFFPRETLQQPASQAGSSSTGAFLSAAAERVPQAVLPRECNIQDDSRRKRKTRKSVQREKLEQTFKEKGFLIQTQQLESAEGATYCKFRQLRKFTRYLFRSWKDYLPGNVRELNENGEPIASLKDIEQDLESLPVSPSPTSNPEFQPNFIEPNSPQSLSLN